MAYQVLALKYRPQTFDEVVGQSHVTTTLSNAILSDRVAHAILFTGPRGTGKTTIARILAKAMNCIKGPSPHPCNTCKICTDIIEGHCTDVFEIDGASNNSVDQIRDLRENVTYMPSSALYKIYIIDEVHMLSTAAFNALLKTLEEPPEHVMFIFATTEVHKLPATILSRCQRHDLNRISLAQISSHLQHLCHAEGFSVEQRSLDLIAQEADGSIRDALSLLDRLLSSATASEIGHQSVLEGLGILDGQILHDISGAIFETNGAKIIEIIEKVNDSGIDLKKFYSDLILHFRNLNVIKLCGKDSLAANITDHETEKSLQAVSSLSGGFINTILQTLLDEESLVKYSSHTRTAIEMVLLKLLQINPGAQIDQIIKKLDLLAKQIDSPPPFLQHKFEPGQEPGLKPADKKPSGTKPSDLKPGAKDSQTPGPGQVEPSHVDTSHMEAGNTDNLAIRESAPAAEYTAKKAPSTGQKDIPDEKTWQGYLKKIEKKLPSMFSLLSKGSVKLNNESQIIVEVEKFSSFDKKRLESKKQELQNICKDFLGKQLAVNIVYETKGKNQPSPKKDGIKAKQAAFSHPLVVEAQKLFNGEIINY